MRPILDEGAPITTAIRGLRDKLEHGHWNPDWPLVPRSFFAEVLDDATAESFAAI